MIDIFFYYLFIGLAYNVIMAAWVSTKGYAIDPTAAFYSVVIWPITLISLIATLLRKE